jgi:3'-5' exoribonuclease
MNIYIESLTRKAKSLGDDVWKVSEQMITSPFFEVWSGSSKPFQHHYGKGGLARHISEVVDLCFMVKDNYRQQYEIDPKELFFAALFHDMGKLHDYEPADDTYNNWISKEHKRTIHHISRSGIIWSNNAQKSQGIYDMYFEKVLHAILSHHGQREWGSPVAPKSRVAWLVHHCDCISARMYDADSWDEVRGEVKSEKI